ncbi:hypothetical protein ACYUJ6_10780 [Clostridium sp. JNZ X4-2]
MRYRQIVNVLDSAAGSGLVKNNVKIVKGLISKRWGYISNIIS